MNKKIKIILIIAIIIILGYAVFYLTEYHHAEKAATQYINGTENVSVTRIDDALYLDGYGNDTALIFYPGAKNEYIAYLPMLVELANSGVDCYLCQMPLNFAIFDSNRADAIIEDSNYSRYIVSGHSLGGLSAANYINNTEKADGLILISAYPVVEIQKPALSIYGSNDGVLNMKAYNESKPLMSNLTEFVIYGGNHAQFAYYGKQEGDNMASITAEDQQNQAVKAILDFISKIT